MNRLKTSRGINLVFGGVIILLISGIIFLFIRHRLHLKALPTVPSPQKTEANITIKDFQHVASENGRIQWTLEAGTASIYSAAEAAELINLSAKFFLKQGRFLTITADRGDLDSKTNNMHLTGSIRAEMADYVLVTESLNYKHQSRIIEIDAPFDISGPLMTLAADAMTYDIDTEVMRCSGNVNGSFIENLDNAPK